jgi:PilZ domain
MSFESSGADYLRRLKQDEEQPVEPPPLPTACSSPEASAGSAERRQSTRYKCEGSAEFRVGGSDVRTWGTFTDLSLHGCYIEMTATYPVGAMVDLGLELKGLRVDLRGEVRVSYPFLGIGVAFREISEDNRQRLQEMVHSLLPAARTGSSAPSPAPGSSLPVIVNPTAAVQALVDFFQARHSLTQEEFVQLIRKSQSSAR